MIFGRTPSAAMIAALATACAAGGAFAQSAYTVRHTVSATAADAVKAKAAALARGRQEAARIVFKRVVPLSAQSRIPNIDAAQAEDMLDSTSVRSEQNSTTSYIATLSFSFQPGAVRETLQSHGLPVIDRQAQPTRILPIVIADGAVKPESREGWGSAWGAADLTGSLAPLVMVKPDASLTPDLLKKILEGDRAAFDSLKQQAGAQQLVIAVGSPLDDGKGFATRLFGDDAVGQIDLSRTDRIFGGDVRDAAKRAAIVGQRIIETRWKISQGGDTEPMPWSDQAAAPAGQDGFANDPFTGQAPLPVPEPEPQREEDGGRGGSFFGNLFGFGSDEPEPPARQPAAAPQRVTMTVQFEGMQQWQIIRSELVVVPGVEALEIGSLSARSAQIAFTYTGDRNRLSSDLAQRGLNLRSGEGGMVLVQN